MNDGEKKEFIRNMEDALYTIRDAAEFSRQALRCNLSSAPTESILACIVAYAEKKLNELAKMNG